MWPLPFAMSACVCVYVGFCQDLERNNLPFSIRPNCFYCIKLGKIVWSLHVAYVPSIEPPLPPPLPPPAPAAAAAAAPTISFSCKLFGSNISLTRLAVSWPLWLWLWCCLRLGLAVVKTYGVGVVVVVGRVISLSSVKCKINKSAIILNDMCLLFLPCCSG